MTTMMTLKPTPALAPSCGLESNDPKVLNVSISSLVRRRMQSSALQKWKIDDVQPSSLHSCQTNETSDKKEVQESVNKKKEYYRRLLSPKNVFDESSKNGENQDDDGDSLAGDSFAGESFAGNTGSVTSTIVGEGYIVNARSPLLKTRRSKPVSTNAKNRLSMSTESKDRSLPSRSKSTGRIRQTKSMDNEERNSKPDKISSRNKVRKVQSLDTSMNKRVAALAAASSSQVNKRWDVALKQAVLDISRHESADLSSTSNHSTGSRKSKPAPARVCRPSQLEEILLDAMVRSGKTKVPETKATRTSETVAALSRSRPASVSPLRQMNASCA